MSFEKNKPYKNLQLKIDKKDDYKNIMDQLKQEFTASYDAKKTDEDKKYTIDHFQLIKTIGIGAFGQVVLVRETATETAFAMKALKKKFIIQNKQLDHIMTEKRVLMAINFPFLINGKCCFQNNGYLFLIMPFVNGGEMFTYLRRYNFFEEELSRFYGAQVLLALEYMHYLNLAYRDLKPENILIDAAGYIKIVDYGFVKMLTSGRAYSFCGTPEYIAPEIILQKGYNHSVDWWSYGILLYEMSAGYPPFSHDDPMKLYDKVLNSAPKFPATFSNDLRDLIKNLLQTDLTRRFGNLKNGVHDIKDHKWFSRTSFMNIYNRTVKAPFTPAVKSAKLDTSNFDTYEDVILRDDSRDNYAFYFKDF